MTYSGPVPPPQLVREWEAIVPGSADRLLTMAENQSNHRIDIEGKVIESNVQNERRSQNFSFILALIAIVGGIWLLSTGHDITGLSTLVGTLVSLVTVFVVGKKKGQAELDTKKKKIKGARR